MLILGGLERKMLSHLETTTFWVHRNIQQFQRFSTKQDFARGYQKHRRGNCASIKLYNRH